ncbi:MAG: DUF6186 family protein [Actinomycetes bacterium]
MTPRAASITGFVVLLLVGVGLELWARTTARVPRAAPSVSAAMRTTPGRVAVFAWWLWLGIHFLAR